MGLESATATNTGSKRTDSLLANALAASRRALMLLGLLSNKGNGQQIANEGASVAAGGDVVPLVTITPKYTGRVKITWFMNWGAPGAGVVTPQIGDAVHSSPLGSLIGGPAFAGANPGSWSGSMEIALVVGTSYDFGLTTTAGDATITLGDTIAATIAAGLLVEEVLS